MQSILNVLTIHTESMQIQKYLSSRLCQCLSREAELEGKLLVMFVTLSQTVLSQEVLLFSF